MTLSEAVREAQRLRRLHGGEASAVAERRAKGFDADGDEDRATDWRRVANAARVLESQQPH